MMQDYAAARVVMAKSAEFVQLPCVGVVSAFTASKQEMEEFLVGKNPLADYLAENFIKAGEEYAKGRDWTRAIWDVTAVAYLLTDEKGFMEYGEEDILLPGYDGHYEKTPLNKKCTYVFQIWRDKLMNDLFACLLK